MKTLSFFFFLLASFTVLPLGVIGADDEVPQLFDMDAIRDASTLDVEVLQDWHLVDGRFPSRQKLVTIHVGEFWPGQNYRMPVRLVVPAEGKAKGFQLTGGSNPKALKQDKRISASDAVMLEGGVGFVTTVVQVLAISDLQELGKESEERFAKSLNPHDKIQYWAWPATLMRAITLAHSESEHFEPGKIVGHGGSKNGATPSLALIHDDRMTGVFAQVSPIWESPLRLCEDEAWAELREHWGEPTNTFLGGHYGPSHNKAALAAGRSWEDLQDFAKKWSKGVFISMNLDALRARGAEMMFVPGSHDSVIYDLAWGGEHYPSIPLYLTPNSGHGQKKKHPATERGQNNKGIFMLRHFFPDEVEPLLAPPAVQTEQKGDA
ncbi:MAG: hypothetical protein AAF226_16705, partial [Verrucomicrobiota bacterium]